MKTTRSDWIAKIAEALTGKPLPRRQSTNVIDRRGEPKGSASTVKDQSRLIAKPAIDAETSKMNYSNARWRLSSQHRRLWGSE